MQKDKLRFMLCVNFTYLLHRVSSNTLGSGYVKYHAFFHPYNSINIENMIIDYSKQAGKNLTTKGYKKNIIIIEEIIYIKCEDHLSSLHLITGAVIPEIKTLCQFEKELGNLGFFRIRDNTIINGKYITEVDSRIDKRAVKLGKTCFIVSKKRLKSFIDWIS